MDTIILELVQQIYGPQFPPKSLEFPLFPNFFPQFCK